MSPFPDRLHLEDVGLLPDYAGRCFRLESDFRVITSKGLVIVPNGFVTDGASIPKVFWSIFSPTGKAFPSAVFHDWGYSQRNDRFTRQEVDAIFKELMFNSKIGWFQREAIYRAVRLFGGRFYRGL